MNRIAALWAAVTCLSVLPTGASAMETIEIDGCKPYSYDKSGGDPNRNFLVMTSPCRGHITATLIHSGTNAAENASAWATITRSVQPLTKSRGCQSGGNWDDHGFNKFNIRCTMTYDIDPGFERRDARNIHVFADTNKVATHEWTMKVTYTPLSTPIYFQQSCDSASTASYSTDNFSADKNDRRAAVVVSGDKCGGVFKLSAEGPGEVVIEDAANYRLPVSFCKGNTCPRNLTLEPGKTVFVVDYSRSTPASLLAAWYPRGPKPQTVDWRCDAKMNELCYFTIFYADRESESPRTPLSFTMQGGTVSTVSDVVPTRDEYCGCLGGSTPSSLELCKGTYQGKQCHRGVVSSTGVNH